MGASAVFNYGRLKLIRRYECETLTDQIFYISKFLLVNLGEVGMGHLLLHARARLRPSNNSSDPDGYLLRYI